MVQNRCSRKRPDSGFFVDFGWESTAKGVFLNIKGISLNNSTISNRCIFCSAAAHDRKIDELNSVFAIRDKFPVTPLHTLVTPFRHVSDWFDLTESEREDSEQLFQQLRKDILATDPSVTGFNVGVNCGVSEAQTFMRVHNHLILRRDGDVENCTGGVRGVIPERRVY